MDLQQKLSEMKFAIDSYKSHKLQTKPQTSSQGKTESVLDKMYLKETPAE